MWELAIILAIWFCRRLTYQHIIFVLENRKPRLQGKTFMLGHVLLTMCTETSSYLLCSNGDQVKRRGVWFRPWTDNKTRILFTTGFCFAVSFSHGFSRQYHLSDCHANTERAVTIQSKMWLHCVWGGSAMEALQKDYQENTTLKKTDGFVMDIWWKNDVSRTQWSNSLAKRRTLSSSALTSRWTQGSQF